MKIALVDERDINIELPLPTFRVAVWETSGVPLENSGPAPGGLTHKRGPQAHCSLTAPSPTVPKGRRSLDSFTPAVRIVLRPLHHTLTDLEANRLRDIVYRAVHQGPHLELIAAD